MHAAQHPKFHYRVAGVVVDRGSVLLQRRAGEEHWSLPGGSCDFGEKAGEALARELKRETGIEMRAGPVLWLVENFTPESGAGAHELSLYFAAEPMRPNAIPRTDFTGADGDSVTFRWFGLVNMQGVDLRPAFLKGALLRIPNRTQHVIVE